MYYFSGSAVGLEVVNDLGVSSYVLNKSSASFKLNIENLYAYNVVELTFVFLFVVVSILAFLGGKIHRSLRGAGHLISGRNRR